MVYFTVAMMGALKRNQIGNDSRKGGNREGAEGGGRGKKSAWKDKREEGRPVGEVAKTALVRGNRAVLAEIIFDTGSTNTNVQVPNGRGEGARRERKRGRGREAGWTEGRGEEDGVLRLGRTG